MKGFENAEALEAILKYCGDHEEELAEEGIYKCVECGKWFIDFDYSAFGYAGPRCLECARKHEELGG